jgi:uncharacterized membrane protein YdjX (TVP38/TMEM64 family)
MRYSLKSKILTFLPLCLIIAAMLIIYFTHLRHQITFQNIKEHHEIWKTLAHDHPILSALIFIGALALSICFVLPNTLLLGILAGFLFPLPLAILYISLGETVGSYLFYEAVGLAFTPPKHKNRKSWFWKFEKKIQANQISYLLFFRFTHFMPFFLLNSAAACFEIRRWTFLWTAYVGILPFAYVVAQGGSGLDTFFESNTHFSLDAFFNTKVKFALLCLGILALIPIFWKIFRKKSA